MAVNGGFIGDATGGIGQGLAFVLPQSKTESYAMQLGQQHAADLRATALAQAKRQQDLQDQYKKDFTATKIPEYWSTAGKPINEAYAKYQTDAADYMAKTGKNPFNSPDFIKQYNETVLLPARQSKEVEQIGEKLIPMIAADHDNKFTEDSKQQVLQWWDKAQKDPSSVFGQPAPQLSGTPSGIQDFYKTIKPVSIKNDNGTLSTTVPDKSAMQAQAYTNSADPRWNNLKKTQYGIDPDLGDIGGVYNKEGKRVWYTNPAATEHIAQAVLDNPTEPHNAEIIAKLNIRPDDPYAVQKVQDAIVKQNTGYGKFISDAGKYGESIVSKSRDFKPAFTPYQIFEMNWKKSHPNGDKAPSEPTYTQDLFERMRTGVPGSGEELSTVFANNPSYLNGLVIDKTNPSKIKITVPTRYKTDPANIVIGEDGKPVANSDRKLDEAAHTYTLDSTNPVQFAAGLAQIYKLGTGENVVPTKGLTQSGKGKVKDGLNPVQKTNDPSMTKSVPMSKVKSLVGKKGYEGYTEKELIDYYKSQGYSIK